MCPHLLTERNSSRSSQRRRKHHVNGVLPLPLPPSLELCTAFFPISILCLYSQRILFSKWASTRKMAIWYDDDFFFSALHSIEWEKDIFFVLRRFLFRCIKYSTCYLRYARRFFSSLECLAVRISCVQILSLRAFCVEDSVFFLLFLSLCRVFPPITIQKTVFHAEKKCTTAKANAFKLSSESIFCCVFVKYAK